MTVGLLCAVLLCLMPHRWAFAQTTAMTGNQESAAPDSRAAQAEAPFAFDTGTVKPAAPSPDGHTHIYYPEGGAFRAVNITVSALMQWAYEMPEKNILNGPAWLTATRYDFQAKADAETDERLRKLPSQESNAAKRRMVQGLLTERFALQLHRETQVLPAYDLVLAKGGATLEPSRSGGKSIGVGRTHFNGQGLTSTVIAEELSAITGQIVVDKTGLTDRYDLKLQWAPDDATGDTSLPSLPVALQEQLGLRLVRTKEPVPVIVIDHIEPPSAN